jgi:hypothetical protein
MSNLNDVVGKANLYDGVDYEFVNDRFCQPNSSIHLNQGNLQVPKDVYFSGDFTVTLWIFLKSNPLCAEIICLKLIRQRLIKLNNWYHVATVLDQKILYVYVNGVLAHNGTGHLLQSLERSHNFISKNADAIFDELKIYKGVMTADQIFNDYIKTSKYFYSI